jgi:DNA repair exonuclease SbcCD ATPase subunit
MDKMKYLAFIVVLLFCLPVSADIYKYTGPDGKAYYTDDYSKVPNNQRSKAKEYIGYESGTGSAESGLIMKSEQGGAAQDLKEEKEGKKTESVKSDISDNRRENLKQRKLELENEYNAIEKEKQELERIKSELRTNQQRLEYNSRVKDYNEKIKSYSEKMKSLVSETESYNSEIEKSVRRD